MMNQNLKLFKKTNIGWFYHQACFSFLFGLTFSIS